MQRKLFPRKMVPFHLDGIPWRLFRPDERVKTPVLGLKPWWQLKARVEAAGGVWPLKNYQPVGERKKTALKWAKNDRAREMKRFRKRQLMMGETNTQLQSMYLKIEQHYELNRQRKYKIREMLREKDVTEKEKKIEMLMNEGRPGATATKASAKEKANAEKAKKKRK
eukprot:TRINITY_DN52951_c0_g1_i1.p2 TRINITY_DN52951_c0_g1~~TRINITY_DN52951_c0_g1_i1.p2  ORF type:complete len:167 (-),score=11.04 TRINITY_DN52951_c0_g1_i1:1503-2003(-)